MLNVLVPVPLSTSPLSWSISLLRQCWKSFRGMDLVDLWNLVHFLLFFPSPSAPHLHPISTPPHNCASKRSVQILIQIVIRILVNLILHLLLTSKLITSEEGKKLGLIDAIVSPEELLCTGGSLTQPVIMQY